jgi:hypothetical protein
MPAISLELWMGRSSENRVETKFSPG